MEKIILFWEKLASGKAFLLDMPCSSSPVLASLPCIHCAAGFPPSKAVAKCPSFPDHLRHDLSPLTESWQSVSRHKKHILARDAGWRLFIQSCHSVLPWGSQGRQSRGWKPSGNFLIPKPLVFFFLEVTLVCHWAIAPLGTNSVKV